MIIKLIIRFFVVSISVFILSLACYGFFLWQTYIDETVISGEAYGFIIGDDKLTTYKKAPVALSKHNIRNSVYIEIKVNSASSELLATNPDYTVMVESPLHDVGYPLFKSKERWYFYFNGSYFDTLSLKFCEEKLCEIHRHRKNFELP